MKALLIVCALLAASCSPVRSTPLGGRDVGVTIEDCTQLQRAEIAAEVTMFAWHVSDVGEVTVNCADTGTGGGAGLYILGASYVTVDPAKAPGEELRAAAGHELVHWLLAHGPHPERGRFHVCDWAYNDPPPPYCYPGQRAAVALMSPSLGGSPSGDWTSEAYVGPVAQYALTDADEAFVAWGLSQ